MGSRRSSHLRRVPCGRPLEVCRRLEGVHAPGWVQHSVARRGAAGTQRCTVRGGRGTAVQRYTTRRGRAAGRSTEVYRAARAARR
eukprot:5039983-Prymnesium_polylepis.2